jgi:hypothetical protein
LTWQRGTASTSLTAPLLTSEFVPYLPRAVQAPADHRARVHQPRIRVHRPHLVSEGAKLITLLYRTP